MNLQACGPVKPPLAGETLLCTASQAGGPSDVLLRAAVLPGAPAPTAEIMRLPAQETPLQPRAAGCPPTRPEPSGDSCASPAVAGHLSQDLVGRQEGPQAAGQMLPGPALPPGF